jgi:hypothetical protein
MIRRVWRLGVLLLISIAILRTGIVGRVLYGRDALRFTGRGFSFETENQQGVLRAFGEPHYKRLTKSGKEAFVYICDPFNLGLDSIEYTFKFNGEIESVSY